MSTIIHYTELIVQKNYYNDTAVIIKHKSSSISNTIQFNQIKNIELHKHLTNVKTNATNSRAEWISVHKLKHQNQPKPAR